jgi:hypothetical protein
MKLIHFYQKYPQADLWGSVDEMHKHVGLYAPPGLPNSAPWRLLLLPDNSHTLVVTAQEVGESMGVRADNMLRLVREYVRQHDGNVGNGWHIAKFAGRRLMPIMTCPRLAMFMSWWLGVLKPTKRKERADRMLQPYGGICGMRDFTPGEMEVIRHYHPEYLEADPVVDASAQLDHKPVLDPSDVQPEVWYALTYVAQRLGYSVRHLQRHITKQAESLVRTSDNFMQLIPGETGLGITGKTLMYLALQLPKSIQLRVEMFNALMQGRRSGPQVPLLEDRTRKVDFNDAELAAAAYLELRDERDKAERDLQLTQELYESQAEQDRLNHETRAAMDAARISGLEAERGRLHAALTTVQSRGALVASGEETWPVYTATCLRNEHQLVTISDVVTRIMERWHGHGFVHSLAPGVPQVEAVRRVIRYTVAAKYLRADGKPAIRDAYVGRVQVHKVRIPQYNVMRRRELHREDRNWEYAVWYKPEVVQDIVDNFEGLAKSFAEAGYPCHMLASVTNSVMPEIEETQA